jgi:glucose-1-phosphate cytidylyltransferase
MLAIIRLLFIKKILSQGDYSQTGERIKRIEKYVGDIFCLTYGDGLSSVNIKNLIKFHIKNKKLATVLAVKPIGRFGAINVANDLVKDFFEKPQGDNNWINGGFFVLNKKVFKYMKGDNSIWEREPLENLVKDKQLSALKFNGFWYAMDTLRDKNHLEDLWNKKTPPWKCWDEK